MYELTNKKMKILTLIIILFVSTACLTTRTVVGNQPKKSIENLILNGSFTNEKKYWNPWQYANKYSNLVKVVDYKGKSGNYKALRIENPYAKLIGLNQAVKLQENKIYKLSAAARSTVTNSSAIIFGGRVGIRLPHQKERSLIWMTEFNDWWKKGIVITNKFSGTAIVYIDMGYGNVVSTGEFSDVRVEEITN